MPLTLEELANVSGARLEGSPDCQITAVNTLKSAQTGDITFLANRRYAPLLAKTNASAVILTETDLPDCPTNALVCDDPYLGYAKIANHLYADIKHEPAIADSAVIGEGCRIEDTVTVSANVSIGNNVTVGRHCFIGPGCVIQDNVRIGDNCTFVANVTLCHDIVLGNGIILHPGVVVGSDGFGLAPDKDKWLKIPQIGAVEIMDNVEIGANSTVDRGAIENTCIGTGVKIDNQVQIGHNVIIGENTVIAGCAGIAGSAVVGKRCRIGGAVGIGGHIQIADDVTVTAMSGVPNSIKQPGIYSSGMPISENKVWRRNIIRFRQLDTLIKTITETLEQKLKGETVNRDK